MSSIISCGDAANRPSTTDTVQQPQIDSLARKAGKEKKEDTTQSKPPIEELIKIEYPVKDNRITSPLQIRGKAVGYWFFEANFPIHLYDANDSLLATAIATAEGSWMTEQFVPFTATLNFDKPATQTGTLVFEKSNPSGLKENERALSIAVRF